MIKVPKVDTDDTDLSKLIADALDARKKLIASFEDTCDAEIDERLYKRYMRFLLELFHGKCAYCETEIMSNQPGDVEHFRPKGRVVDDQFKPIRVRHPKWGDIEHPGYFWLAYDWSNLLPSCIDCNRYRKHGSDADSGAGKADRFPVEDFRAIVPGDEVKERPLLLNPSESDPNEHFDFLESGEIKSKTVVGEATLHYLGLNRREKLVKARNMAFRNARQQMEGYLSAVFSNNEDARKDACDLINDLWRGAQPYTAMQRLGIEVIRSRAAASGIVIPMPLPKQ